MKRRKLMVILLVMVMAASTFTGCGSGETSTGMASEGAAEQVEASEKSEAEAEKEDTAAATEVKTQLLENDPEEMAKKLDDVVLECPQMPLVDEPLTLSVIYPKEANHGEFENMFYMNAVKQLTNIELDVQAIEKQGWNEKLGLMFASGDYADIFLAGISFTDAAAYGQAGMLLPLEELMAEYAPNAMKIIDELLPESRRNVTADDGHIYAMPAYDGTPRDMLMDYSELINTEWMKAVGVDEIPGDTEGMYELLKAFKTQDPNGNGEADEIPYSKVYKGEGTDPFIWAFGFVNLRHDLVDGKYVYVPAEDNFRHYLEYMNRLYAEGLIDSEMFTQIGRAHV